MRRHQSCGWGAPFAKDGGGTGGHSGGKSAMPEAGILGGGGVNTTWVGPGGGEKFLHRQSVAGTLCST
jgi:hypothetical protein